MLELLCESDENCTDAWTALSANINCINDDANTDQCSGSCRMLIANMFDVCPDVSNSNEFIATQ